MTDPRALANRHPLDAQGSVELAVVTRSGLDESRHLGAAAVVDASGTLLRAVGDVSASIYPRSCLKPFQALTVLRSGVVLEGAEAVLATASHAGTPAHVEVVERLLTRAGATETDLLCPPDWPSDRAAARVATAKQRVFMNCSGKHAGFLNACAHNGWDRATYDDIDHPLQQAVRATVEEFTDETIDHAGVDGCGAPVFAVTIEGLARGMARLTGSVTSGADAQAAHLVNQVLENAWALDGPDRANTVTIDELGVFAKLGAEGVMVIGTVSGVAAAVKVLDGNLRAGTLAALTLLADMGAIPAVAAARVIDLTGEKVLGGGVVVGGLRPGSGLTGAAVAG